MAEYALVFRTPAAGSGWSEPVLKAAFRQGLNVEVLTELACQGNKASLESVIYLANCLGHLLQNCNRQLPHSNPVSMLEPPEPMQIGHACLSLTERER